MPKPQLTTIITAISDLHGSHPIAWIDGIPNPGNQPSTTRHSRLPLDLSLFQHIVEAEATKLPTRTGITAFTVVPIFTTTRPHTIRFAKLMDKIVTASQGARFK